VNPLAPQTVSKPFFVNAENGTGMNKPMRLTATYAAENLLPELLAVRARPFAQKIDEILTSSDENAIARRMSLITFAIRLVSAAIVFGSQIILARWMGDFEFGIFVLVWTTAVITGSLSTFGFATTLVRYIPQYRLTGSADELRGIMLTGRLFALLAASFIAGTGIGAILYFKNNIESYYVAPFIIGALTLPMIALGDTLEGMARAHAWPVKALSPTYVVRPALLLMFMLGAMLAGFKPEAKTALLAAVLATYLTTIIQLLAITNSVDRILPEGPKSNNFGEWASVSLPIFLVEGFLYLITNADVLFVGMFLQPEKVAIYYAAAKTLMLVHFVYFAVKAGVAQRYSQLIHSGEKLALEQFVRSSARWTFWPSLAVGIIVLILGKFLLSLFGETFTQGYPLLFILIIGVVLRSSIGPAESLLNMSGNERICAVIFGVTLFISVAMAIILIPLYGLYGAAISVATSMTFETLALIIAVWKRLGIKISVLADLMPARGKSAQ
jgi:O-antigen/teichoic acid export membrane protein